MASHILKIAPIYLDAIKLGEKTCEIRKDDRGYCVLSIKPARVGVIKNVY